jgi:hypothetical protein
MISSANAAIPLGAQPYASESMLAAVRLGGPPGRPLPRYGSAGAFCLRSAFGGPLWVESGLKRDASRFRRSTILMVFGPALSKGGNAR